MPQIDPLALRRAFGAFATGVTVVAARAPDGTPAGFTANSFCSVSLEPPLLLVCLARGASSFPVFSQAERFAVSVLAQAQRAVSAAFATRGADKFAAADWRDAPSGAPVIEGCAAWFDCAMERRIEAGDHVMLLGRVTDFADRPAAPLGYHRGHYVELGGAAAGAGAPDLRVAAIVARPDGAVLLRQGREGWGLPVAASFDRGEAGLTALLRASGAGAEPGLVFASADIAGAHWIVYAAEAPVGSDPASGWRFAAPAEAALPPGEAALLRRWTAERDAPVFGRYMGGMG